MATKTEAEKQAIVTQGGTLVRTSPDMKFTLVSDSDYVVPGTLETFLGEGFITQRHVKLLPGKMIRGKFKGMEDGELTARSNGEVPKVKWIFMQTSESVTVRMLGTYNMVSQLENVPIDSDTIIARGVDYDLPNGFRCSDVYVLHNPPKPGQGAAAQVVEVTKQ